MSPVLFQAGAHVGEASPHTGGNLPRLFLQVQTAPVALCPCLSNLCTEGMNTATATATTTTTTTATGTACLIIRPPVQHSCVGGRRTTLPLTKDMPLLLKHTRKVTEAERDTPRRWCPHL
eukprot:106154-Chlamydomonas_euryale.AAC.4